MMANQHIGAMHVLDNLVPCTGVKNDMTRSGCRKGVSTQVWCCAAPLSTASHAVSAAEQENTPPAQGRVAEQPAAETWPYVCNPHPTLRQSNLLLRLIGQTQVGGA